MGMNYEICYKKGKENSTVDALSRASRGKLLHMAISTISTNLWEFIKKEWQRDPTLVQIIQQL